MNAEDVIGRHHVHVCGNLYAPETLVFVHGFATDQRVWREVAAAFEDQYRIVLFDNAGAGAPAPEIWSPANYLNLRGYARDLVEILLAVRVANATLVGHSAGGMMSLLAAVDRPDLVSRLVLLGASPRYMADPGYPGTLTKEDVDRIYSAVMNDYEEWTGSFAERTMENPDRPQLAENFAATLRSMPANRLLNALCALLQTDYRSELPKVRQPTLIVQSENDLFVPAGVADYLREHIAGSRLEVIAARGHFPHVSAPGGVIAAIRGFLPPLGR